MNSLSLFNEFVHGKFDIKGTVSKMYVFFSLYNGKMEIIFDEGEGREIDPKIYFVGYSK